MPRGKPMKEAIGHVLIKFQVKRRVKPPPKDKPEERKEREHFEEREELDFQFDEELDGPVPSGRHNTFTDW
jgi:la-related protein 1